MRRGKEDGEMRDGEQHGCGNLLTQAALCWGSRDREDGVCVHACEVTLTLIGVTGDNHKCLDVLAHMLPVSCQRGKHKDD